MTIPTEKEYLAAEKRRYESDLRCAELGTPEESLEAQAKWVEHLTNEPGLVVERVSWLLAGHYGKGAYDAAWEAVDNPHVKPTTKLLDMIAALEWVVPRGYVVAAWVLVPEVSHKRIDEAIEKLIADEKKERAAG